MRQNLVKKLYDYPFFKLNQLLDGISPPTDVKPIFLHIGEPQIPPPQLLSDEIAKNSHLWAKYPPVKGSIDYLTAVGQWIEKRYDFNDDIIDPNSHIMVSCGSREALFLAAKLAVERKKPQLLDNKKPIIAMPNPLYHVYHGGALMAGAVPYCLSANAENDFIPDFGKINDEILNRIAMIYLCSPANPVGKVASKSKLQNMIELARKYNFILAFDECYSEIYFDKPPIGGLRAAYELNGKFDNILCFNSLSKRSSAPGLRTGFIAGDPQLIADFTMLRSYGGAQVAGPLMAAGAALWRDETHVENNRNHYRKLLKIADDCLGDLPGYIRPDAAFFLWLNVAKSGLTGEKAVKKLWQIAGVKTQAGKFMSRPENNTEENNNITPNITPGDDYIRIALVYNEDIMHNGLSHIGKILRNE